MERQKGTSPIFTIILSIILFFLGIYLGNSGIMGDGEICVEKTCLNQHPDYDYLKKSACSLYENYKNQYLGIDQLINKYPEYRNTAIVKEGYDTFKSWDSFNDKYCK